MKLFRDRSSDDRLGRPNTDDGMGPEKLFMDRSKNARSAGRGGGGLAEAEPPSAPPPKAPSRVPCIALPATEKYRNVAGNGGNPPASAFLARSTWKSPELANPSGISPEIPPLLARMSTLRLGESGRSSPAGTAPSRRFPPRSSVWRSGSPAREAGTAPVSWLPASERRRRRRRPAPRPEGMGPVTRPGYRTRSVSAASVERESGSVPVRPGESASPVPRVSTDTRRTVLEEEEEEVSSASSGAQTTPAYAQGLRVSSQESKKREPGRSRRLARRSRSAAASRSCSVAGCCAGAREASMSIPRRRKNKGGGRGSAMCVASADAEGRGQAKRVVSWEMERATEG